MRPATRAPKEIQRAARPRDGTKRSTRLLHGGNRRRVQHLEYEREHPILYVPLERGRHEQRHSSERRPKQPRLAVYAQHRERQVHDVPSSLLVERAEVSRLQHVELALEQYLQLRYAQQTLGRHLHLEERCYQHPLLAEEVVVLRKRLHELREYRVARHVPLVPVVVRAGRLVHRLAALDEERQQVPGRLKREKGRLEYGRSNHPEERRQVRQKNNRLPHETLRHNVGVERTLHGRTVGRRQVHRQGAANVLENARYGVQGGHRLALDELVHVRHVAQDQRVLRLRVALLREPKQNQLPPRIVLRAEGAGVDRGDLVEQLQQGRNV
ncbi:uncharacterized protein LOC126320002 [Schistocerca gregaria]|uniref:uncharacterized protein LOC126320002 n=1 Tax=Schistocerca gregaria TaxID=7010 RepID=UPI00211ECC54|nr:uncharacterized protein LOC126320002 [Schistocerca gregaria]